MDVLAEILPPSYLVKSETTAKDRQPDQQQEQKSSKQKATVEQKKDRVVAEEESKESQDRRSGSDRREHKKCRGRWLDSRLSEDRRRENSKSAIKLSI